MKSRNTLPKSTIKKITKYLINVSIDFPNQAKVLLELKQPVRSIKQIGIVELEKVAAMKIMALN
jgi:hypothetical protein